MLQAVIFIIIGFVLLIKGADFLVDGASTVAKKFHIPEIIIGLTIVSIGTSMPELFVSTTSAIGGRSDMAIGNVIGSNVCNMLLILGLSSVIRPVKFQKETRLIEIPLCLLFTAIFMIICNTGNVITRMESIALLVIFVMFIGYTIFMAQKGEEFDKEDEVIEETKEKKEISVLKSIVYIVIGIIALKLGGDLTVDNAVIIAKYFKLSEQLISLTILAVGTSLPELVTSVTAAIKDNSDIAIGNIIGSNIFNMLFIIGIASLISPITYNLSYNVDMIISIFSTMLLALFPVIPPKNKMTRANGLVYLMLYAGYLAILFAL